MTEREENCGLLGIKGAVLCIFLLYIYILLVALFSQKLLDPYCDEVLLCCLLLLFLLLMLLFLAFVVVGFFLVFFFAVVILLLLLVVFLSLSLSVFVCAVHAVLLVCSWIIFPERIVTRFWTFVIS